MPKLLIAASGTGGHIFPALAVAEALPSSWEVIWLGVPYRLETKLVSDKYHLETIRVGGLQGNKFRKLFLFFQLVLSTLRVWNLIRNEKINVVFTTGGYIAAPTILSSFILGVPILLHESNAEPGRVTKLLGRFCRIVAIGFSSASSKLKECKTTFTGTPVRNSFFSSLQLPNWVPKYDGPLIVIIGGSQGAIGLNKMVRYITPQLLDLGCRIVHLTGDNELDYQKISHPNYVERAFVNDIPALLQNADLAISRAGAGAISELAICGTPAILVPYPQAKDHHQDVNAFSAASTGAAVIVRQHEPEDQSLLRVVMHLLKYRLEGKSDKQDQLYLMKSAMKNLAVFNSEKKLIEIIDQISS